MKKTAFIVFISAAIVIAIFAIGSRQIKSPASAEETLSTFFSHVSRNMFGEAIDLLDPDESGDFWENVKNFSMPEERENKTLVLKNYCEATGTCLPVEILKTTQESDSRYILTVRFRKPDGTVFVLGPCCGATEEEMPSKTEFDFTVEKISGEFRVLTPPVYVP